MRFQDCAPYRIPQCPCDCCKPDAPCTDEKEWSRDCPCQHFSLGLCHFDPTIKESHDTPPSQIEIQAVKHAN